MSENTEIVVVGGGYAGVMAANRLTRRRDAGVTLINPRPAFVERIRLHQHLTGNHDAAVDYRTVLARSVRLTVDTVTGIDRTERRLTLASGATVHYDYLVYAAGSRSAHPVVPGAADHAHPLAELEDTQRLRPVLDAAAASSPIVVVGAGPTGIETAAELAEAGRRSVTLACGGVLGPYLHPHTRRVTARRLVRLGVTVLEGADTQVTAVTRRSVRLADGRDVPSAVTIWTTGFGVPELARRSGLTTDVLGRLLTDETLTSVDDDRIVAAGDVAAPSNLPYRMSCQAATQLGPQAAETILARLDGEQPEPVEVGFVAQCISLGRRDGVYQAAHRDDTVARFHLAGRTGAAVKELICRSTVWSLRQEAQKPGARTWWFTNSRRRQLLQTPRDPLPVTPGACGPPPS